MELWLVDYRKGSFQAGATVRQLFRRGAMRSWNNCCCLSGARVVDFE